MGYFKQLSTIAQGRTPSLKSASPSVNFRIEGIDETIAVFETIRDQVFKQKRVNQIIRKVLKRYYLPVVQATAESLGPEDRARKFSRSFGFIDSISRPYVTRAGNVTVRVGPRVKQKYRDVFPDIRSKRKSSSRYNYGGGGWLAGFYEYGTANRTTKSGANRGSIPKTKFAAIAYKRSVHIVERMLAVDLKNMMEREFDFASRGISTKGKRIKRA